MLINIFKTVLKDENEADKMLMVEDYPQVWYTDKNHHFIHKIIASQSRKRFFDSLFCTTTDDEPEGVLNSYKYNS